jgi:8-oxo-dGTP diphosphatase
MSAEKFNIRVYGILKHPNGSFLLTNELRNGVKMTKFVGGGLEFNEGVKECLKREFIEEMELAVDVDKLFYINDFLQVSAFNSKDQLLSIYYSVTTNDWSRVEECISNPSKEQSFYWVMKNKLNVEDITFPIDKVVVGMLKG